MDRALFVSDIHIQSPDDPKYRLFLSFLDKAVASPPTHLFLVGDIFDLWISDRTYFVERYAEAVDKIGALVKSGCRVHYFEGNHDLDLKRFWQQELGVQIFEGPAYFHLNGASVRVEHGDQMNPDDHGYRFLRWLLRTPILRILERHLPEPLLRLIGERASRTSRNYTSSLKSVSDEEARVGIRRHAQRAFAERPFEFLISGHVHVPMDEVVSAGQIRYRLINLSAWFRQALVFEMTREAASLKPLTEFV